jgi:glycosyltransferase involved in cell wall biosynthesis
LRPLVSICIPTYNGAKFLLEALNSVKRQTYKNIEVIFSDDASYDQTLILVSRFKKEVNFPVRIYNHRPSVIGANWNNCVKKAKGDYIKFLFQDDVLQPDCIKKMVDVAETGENVGMVYSMRQIISENNTKKHKLWIQKYGELHKHWFNITPFTGIINGKEYLKDKNLLCPPLNKIGEPTAVLLHKNVFKKVGYFYVQLQQALDLEYWYRMMPNFNIGFVNEKLVTFRLHSMQATESNNLKGINDSLKLPFILFRKVYFYLHKTQKKKLLSDIAKSAKGIIVNQYKKIFCL